MNLLEETTSEPLLDTSRGTCKIHGFGYVQMPRDEGEEDFGYVAKCPLRTCPEGR